MTAAKQKVALFWFRRDLRLHDNHALQKACESGLPVLPLFIFDPIILEKLETAMIHGSPLSTALWRN